MDQLTECSNTVDIEGQLLHQNRKFMKPSSHVPRYPVGEEDTAIDN